MDHAGSIMIVEDDRHLRGALAAYLEGEGYTVIEASHGSEALRLLRLPTDVCLILLDMFMPVMNGWTFRSEQLRDTKLAPIPVIVITADASAAQSAATLGVTDFMVKPIDLGRLSALVARHC